MATNTIKGDFPLPKNGYLTFDPLALKAFLKQRLIDNGVITDVLIEGSNISNLVDIIAITFNSLIYYLNQTSSEAIFSDTVLYENMNRLVKLIGYNPIGRQTSMLTFTCSAEDTIPQGLYTIPRYSYLNLGGISYSLNEDITFYKSTSSMELLEDFSNNKILFQGRWIEYPTLKANGEENELVYMLPGDNVIIDHFNIDVYILDVNINNWVKWERTNSLYLERSNDLKYEIRMNENKHYEIKFGNNINGKKLNTGDIIAIYYLKSEGVNGEVASRALIAGQLIPFQTTQFDQIFNDSIITNVTLLNNNYYTALKFDNESGSTYYSDTETVDEIKQNAPNVFRTQYRLVTESDFENYILTNYSNLIHDVKVYNNSKYLIEYMKYFYNMGITNPNNVGRVLYNQVQFADACNFNNVYLFIVPKLPSNSTSNYSYLNPSLKTLIINSMKDVKLLTCEPLIVDPVYMSIDISLASSGAIPSLNDINDTELYVIQKINSRRDSSAIQNDINNIFINYFDKINTALGQNIDIDLLTNTILSIDGVETFYTRSKSNITNAYQGLSLLMWDSIYEKNLEIINKNTSLYNFQIPYLNNSSGLLNKIVVQPTYKVYETIEY